MSDGHIRFGRGTGHGEEGSVAVIRRFMGETKMGVEGWAKNLIGRGVRENYMGMDGGEE